MKRKYNISDAKFIVSCSVILNDFETYLDDFTDFNSRLNHTYLDELKKLLNSLNEQLSDNYYKYKVAEINSEILEKVNKVRRRFQEIKFYTEQAFPENSDIKHQAGIYRFREVYHKPEALYFLMKKVEDFVKNHMSELKAGGFRSKNYAQLKTENQELHQLLELKTQHINERKQSKIERIQRLNHLWTYFYEIRRCAYFIYSDKPTMKMCFTFPKAGKGHVPINKEDNEQEIFIENPELMED